MRLSCFVPILASFLFLSTLGAHADDIKGFTLSGVFDSLLATGNLPYTSVSGVIQIDTTTGVVTEVDLTDPLGPSIPFQGTSVSYASTVYPYTEVDEEWGIPGNDYFTLSIYIPGPTLVGYDGGDVCSLYSPCDDGIYSQFGGIHSDAFVYGALSPTPEPSSLALISAGALAMIGLLGRKSVATPAHSAGAAPTHPHPPASA